MLKRVHLWHTFSRCEYTLESSYVVYDILWCFLRWTLGLNKHSWKCSPTVVWKALQSCPVHRPPGWLYEGTGEQHCAGSSRLRLHTNLKPFFSKSLLGYYSLCLRYTVRQENFFSPSYLKFRAHSSWQSGAHYQLALVFSSCAVLTMILS